MSAKLISIIGPPASGKTTLAQALCAALEAQLVKEDFAGNPFLADSYLGNAQARLPGQLYFLMSRVQQLAQASWPATGVHVSDYGFCQDRIFAQLKLDAAEFDLYEPVRAKLENLVHPPDLLIHLHASSPILLERIARRGRDFERVMKTQFLEDISNRYVAVVSEQACPMISIDTGLQDLREENNCRELAQQIRHRLNLPANHERSII